MGWEFGVARCGDHATEGWLTHHLQRLIYLDLEPLFNVRPSQGYRVLLILGGQRAGGKGSSIPDSTQQPHRPARLPVSYGLISSCLLSLMYNCLAQGMKPKMKPVS